MREFSVYAVIIITFIIMVRYILLLVKKEIKPALAMWFFCSAAIVMSLETYQSDGGYGFPDNICAGLLLLLMFRIEILKQTKKTATFLESIGYCVFS